MLPPPVSAPGVQLGGEGGHKDRVAEVPGGTAVLQGAVRLINAVPHAAEL